ncbi:MAG TPA: substrate-binding domain-containing protein [Polyangiaceae bacterium]|nr:substrate-binding domain-containing protein [Polyangiaceae bacterium]
MSLEPRPARKHARADAARNAGPRIAFLAAYMNNAYEWDIWRGVRAAVEERGGSVVCFAGSGLGDPDPEHRARATLFDLVHPSNADAILCLTSVVSPFAGVSGTEDWALARGLPVCSIGPAERVPSVSIDDAAGITQLMVHLIDHHGHRRIAFIKGAELNQEAQQRLVSYERTLAKYGIALDPRLVLDGDFTTESGARAIRELFDRRQVPIGEIDAVVACNDYMAFGAVDELVRRRISVPDQVAVVGFDDITPARVHSPPLTTVRQPLEELGRAGAELLLDVLAGKSVNHATTLETELVLRRSCGCVPTSRFVLPEESVDRSGAGDASTRAVLRSALEAELHGEPGTFAFALEPILRDVAASGSTEFDAGRRFADEFCTRMRLVGKEVVYERLTRLARVLHTKMFGPQAYLSTALAEHLPSFEIHECAVSELVLTPGASSPLSQLKLAFGFDATTLQPQMVAFDGHALVPPHFENLRHRSVFVMPLTCGPQPLGITVLPAGSQDGGFYETLAELFATVLKVLEVRRGPARA